MSNISDEAEYCRFLVGAVLVDGHQCTAYKFLFLPALQIFVWVQDFILTLLT